MGLGHRPPRAKKIHKAGGERFRIAAAAGGATCHGVSLVDRSRAFFTRALGKLE